MKVSVVIPCYKSETTVEGVVDRVLKTLAAHGYDGEVVCVNDCSPDGTIQTLRRIAEDNSSVKVLSLSKNFGQHSALMAGLHHVTGDIVAFVDDDGETPPENLPLLIDKLSEGYDLVSAKYPAATRSFIREIGSRISMMMSRKLVGLPKGIEMNTFCVFRRFICDEIIKYTNPYPFIHGLMLRVTRNVANVEMGRGSRQVGESGYTFTKLVSLLLNGFTAFSVKPLRIASVFGAVFSAVGLIVGVLVVIRKLLDPFVPMGYSSLMAVMLLFFGFTLLFLGLIGEYVGRTYISLNKAPQFVIRESLNVSSQDAERIKEP